jgi:hypothetical protein
MREMRNAFTIFVDRRKGTTLYLEAVPALADVMPCANCSSVNHLFIATSTLALPGRKIVMALLAGARDLSILHDIQIGSRAHPTPMQWVPGALS